MVRKVYNVEFTGDFWTKFIDSSAVMNKAPQGSIDFMDLMNFIN